MSINFSAQMNPLSFLFALRAFGIISSSKESLLDPLWQKTIKLAIVGATNANEEVMAYIDFEGVA